jgi:hypothetical protein
MDSSLKLSEPDDFDNYISAELLDEKKYPFLHKLVCKHMMHGPSGVLNRNCGCMQDGACRFRYPKQFSETTEQGKDAYPIYRRQNDGHKLFVRKKWLDNKWIVPYNYHINVEVSSSIKCCKYLYKYVYKGTDCASFAIANQDQNGEIEINEIKQYRKARCITSIEAVYRLYRFPMFSMYPPILQMQVHLPGMHMVPFNDDDNLEDVLERARNQRSMLT